MTKYLLLLTLLGCGCKDKSVTHIQCPAEFVDVSINRNFCVVSDVRKGTILLTDPSWKKCPTFVLAFANGKLIPREAIPPTLRKWRIKDRYE